ncbi:MAG: radical SAM protein [Oscillospiraceae bacterium]|nr:radical SAM protein [Oscillospiraceae bacterium]
MPDTVYCSICPRRCGADRSSGHFGVCGVPDEIMVARAALHYWEEPCISGERGSGTVFFSGCALRCVFCQNREISRGYAGKVISVQRLSEIFMELQEKGAHNINLVTPDHYCRQIGAAVAQAREHGLSLPVVTNTGGYVSAEQFEIMSGYTDIWLTDFKYDDPELAMRYSGAIDYPRVAAEALDMMVGSAGKPAFSDDGILRSGVIVRILLLPGHVDDAVRIVDRVWKRHGDSVILSLMNQYTPPSGGLPEHPELMRTVTEEEYDELIDHALSLGIENAYIQEGGTQDESFIPPFDMEGV